MRRVLALLAACSTAAGATLPAAPAIRSESLGWGPGMVIDEVTRDADRSLFHLVRSYDWSKDPATAWGTGQSWFVLCAIGGLADERGFRAFRFVMQTGEPGNMRPMGPTDQFKDVPADQLYERVDWLADGGGNPADLVSNSVVPVNDTLRRFFSDTKARASQRGGQPTEAPGRTP